MIYNPLSQISSYMTWKYFRVKGRYVYYALSLTLNTNPAFDGKPQQRPTTTAGGHQW